MNLFALSGLLIGITSATMGIFVYIKNPKNTINRLWAIFTFSVAFWGFGAFKIGITRDANSALFWWRAAHIGVIFIPVIFVHFVYTFLSKKEKWPVIVGYALGLFFLISNLTGHLIKKVEWVFNSFYYDGRPPTTLYAIFTFLWFLAIAYSHFQLLLGVRGVGGIKKNQIKYFFLATAVGFSGGITCFIPVFGINMYPYGNFTVPLYPLIMSYAIVKYRLMNIEQAVAMTVGFGLICMPIVAVPFIIGYITKSWVIATILATILAPASFYIYNRTKKRLIAEQFAFQNSVIEISENIKNIRILSELTREIVTQIQKKLKFSFVGLYLHNSKNNNYVLKADEKDRAYKEVTAPMKYSLVESDPIVKLLFAEKNPVIREEISLRFNNRDAHILKETESQMKSQAIYLALPIFFEEKGEISSIIMLGERLSHNPCTDNEIKALNLLSEHIAFAIRNAQYIEKKEHKAIQDVAMNASHQMLNSLGNIQSCAEVVYIELMERSLENLPPGEALKLFTLMKMQLKEVLKATKEGKEMLESILYRAKVKENLAEINVFTVTKYAIERSSQIKSKELLQENIATPTIINNIPQSFCSIIANERLIIEILVNLINNAYDAIVDRYIFLKPGKAYKGRIMVNASDKNDRITISVKDNGIGMKDEVKEKLFKEFFTTKSSAQKKISGAGVGLFAIKDWVEQHSGNISFISKYGKGTIFTLELPKRQEEFNGFKDPDS